MQNLKLSFELKEEHLKLLRNMCVRWDDCEFGAPAIDCKRPYGNSGVYKDMAKILGIKGIEDDEGDIVFTRDQIEFMNMLHKETEIALQIVLKTGRFETGIFVSSPNYGNWSKKE